MGEPHNYAALFTKNGHEIRGHFFDSYVMRQEDAS